MAITQKVDKLLATGFTREVLYPTWLANMIMVKKSNRKWRMCNATILFDSFTHI